MNLRSKIKSLLKQALEENPSLFLIDLKISLENNIKVVLDGDDEVSLIDCIKISRVIEHNLDREVVDFSLEVTSAGVGEPLFNRRQYLKNIGRKLMIAGVGLFILSMTINFFDSASADQEKWAARQPEWVEMSVKPPEVQLFDLNSGERYRITAFWGDDVAWYPSKGLYLAFMMWGIEGKQLNRNVGLTSLAERVRMIDAKQMPLGVEALTQTTNGK